MARMMFGGGPEDVYLIPDDEGDLRQGGGVVIRMHSTETGENPITDLLDINLSPITTVTTSTGGDGRVSGQIAPFWGPDGVYEMWAGAENQPRFLLQASNLGSQLGPIRDQYLQHAAQSNGHGTRLQDLVNVNSTGVGAATNGQALVFNSTSGLWTAGTVAGGSSTPTNMATTDTAQTITGAKTFTGGVTARPAATTGAAQVNQALASQTGNVEEWRDSGGTTKAWITSDLCFRAPNTSQTITFAKAGAIAAGVGTFRWWNDRGVAVTILSVRATLGTAGSTSTIVDVNVSGTTAYATQANRPTIAAAALTSGKSTNFSVTTIPDGGYLTADIDSAGTGAADLVVQVEIA